MSFVCDDLFSCFFHLSELLIHFEFELIILFSNSSVSSCFTARHLILFGMKASVLKVSGFDSLNAFRLPLFLTLEGLLQDSFQFFLFMVVILFLVGQYKLPAF